MLLPFKSKTPYIERNTIQNYWLVIFIIYNQEVSNLDLYFLRKQRKQIKLVSFPSSVT